MWLWPAVQHRHTQREGRAGGGFVRKGALGIMSCRKQELTVSPEAQEDSGAPSFPVLNQELKHSSRGPRGAQRREHKGKDCALRGPERTVRSNG